MDIKEKLNFVNKMTTSTNTKTYIKDEIILNNYQIKQKIGIIITGEANILKTDINGNISILGRLRNQDIFSDLFFVNTEDEVFIKTKKETKVLFIDHYQIISSNNKIDTLNLFNLIIEENKKLNEKIDLLTQRNLKDRLLHLINKYKDKNNVFKLTVTYKELAEYLSVDRASLMRILTQLENENLIKRNQKTIKLII